MLQKILKQLFCMDRMLKVLCHPKRLNIELQQKIHLKQLLLLREEDIKQTTFQLSQIFPSHCPVQKRFIKRKE